MLPSLMMVIMALALAVVCAAGGAPAASAQVDLDEALVATLDFDVPGMRPYTPRAAVAHDGSARGVPYLYPRAGRGWISQNGAVEIAAGCAALKDAAAARRFLPDQISSGVPVPKMPSGVGVGDAVSAGQYYGYAFVAYGRFVITVSRVNRIVAAVDGATPAPVPDMMESIARAVAYSLLRSGLVKDDAVTRASVSHRRPLR